MLELLGRSNDMYKSSGENVYPVEVEAVIDSHEAVLESAVVGIPDPTRGQVGAAFVRLHETVTLDREPLLQYIGERLMKFKWPVKIEFVDDFPRSFATQEIRKFELVKIGTTQQILAPASE